MILKKNVDKFKSKYSVQWSLHTLGIHLKLEDDQRTQIVFLYNYDGKASPGKLNKCTFWQGPLYSDLHIIPII